MNADKCIPPLAACLCRYHEVHLCINTTFDPVEKLLWIQYTFHLFRSACACRHAASPLNADRLNDASPLHPLRPDRSSTRVSAISSPRSTSLSRGIGIAADGDSLVVSAARTWTSSAPGLSWYGVSGGDSRALEDRAIERTTSFLQIGQVRRLVVNQGVLKGR